MSTRNYKAGTPALESCAHQEGKHELLKCQRGTGERLGAAWQHRSQRSWRGANTVSKVKKGHAKCIPCQIYVKGRLWHTSNSFLMKTLGKGTILFLAFLRSAQGAEGSWLWGKPPCALHCSHAVTYMGLLNTSEILSVTMTLFWLRSELGEWK